VTEPGQLTRVVVVDDQSVIRAGLRMIIDHEPDLTVVGEAADGLEALDVVGRVDADVVLMDIRMPRLDGLEATRRLRAGGPGGPAVVVLTTFDDEEYVLGAVRAGASGFLLKDAGPDLLVQGIRAAHRGDALVDPAVTGTLIARCLELEKDAAKAELLEPQRWETAINSLSAREREVLIGMARGYSNRRLSREFHLGETTVKTHVSNVLAKLGAASRVEAVVVAYESGLVRPGAGAAEE
jgi:DNA-binding NarL/FixJ family response regulator